MSWPLYLALKQLFPTGKRVPLFTVLSSFGVALGVTVLIVTLSVMGGFGYEIRQMILDTTGEVQVRSMQPGGLLREPGALLAAAREVPEVVAGTAFADGVAMAMHESIPAFPAIHGIDVSTVQNVFPVDRFVRVGRLDDLDDDSVILSAALARGLGAFVGSKITIATPLMLERQSRDELMLPREFAVVGIYEVGHNQLDGSIVICTLRTMQDLYGLGDAVHGLSLKLKPGADVDTVAAQLDDALRPRARAQSWYELSRDFLFILKLEKNMLFFLLLFIVLVAGFSVAIGLFVSVVRKTREIGLLAALGGDTRGVAACFCYQGLFIGITGTALGALLGFTAVWLRNDAIQLFARLTQSKAALERFYMFSVIPAHLETRDLLLVLVSSVSIATLAALVPAWRAARLKPSEALRSE